MSFSFVRPFPPELAASCIFWAIPLADSDAASKGPENLLIPGIAFDISASPLNDFTPILSLISLEDSAILSNLFCKFWASLTWAAIESAISLFNSASSAVPSLIAFRSCSLCCSKRSWFFASVNCFLAIDSLVSVRPNDALLIA